MGTLLEKLTYLSNAVNDIQAAIAEKDIAIDNTVPLEEYGNKIREIKGAIAWADYIAINGYESIGEEDLIAKDIEDVTDLALTDSIEGVDIKAYNTYSAHSVFTEEELVSKEFEDATESMEIRENNYTNL